MNAGNGLPRRPARVPAHRPRHGAADDLPVTDARPARRRRRRQDGHDPGRDLPGGRPRHRPVLLEWHSLDHIPITESYWPLTDELGLRPPELDRASTATSNLLVSSRNTHTIYKIDRRNGRDHLAAGRQAQQLRVDRRRRLRLAARRAPPARRLDHDLRQRRRASRARCVLARRRDAPARHARAAPTPIRSEPARHQPGQRPGAAERQRPRRLGRAALRLRVHPRRRAPLRRPARHRTTSPTAPTARRGRARAPGAPAVARAARGAHTDVYVSWNGDTRVARWVVARRHRRRDDLAPIGSVRAHRLRDGHARSAARPHHVRGSRQSTPAARCSAPPADPT